MKYLITLVLLLVGCQITPPPTVPVIDITDYSVLTKHPLAQQIETPKYNKPVWDISIQETTGKISAASHYDDAFITKAPFNQYYELGYYSDTWECSIYKEKDLSSYDSLMVVCATRSLDPSLYFNTFSTYCTEDPYSSSFDRHHFYHFNEQNLQLSIEVSCKYETYSPISDWKHQ